jgi:hypothetical protein
MEVNQFLPPAHRRANILVALVLGCAAAIAVAAGACSLRWPLVHDPALFHYIASAVKDGAVPYRDIFDVNFPGTYLVHMFVLSIPGDMDLVWRLFELAILTATLLLMATFMGWRKPWSAAAACIIFALFCLRGGAGMSGQRDMYTVTLEMAAILSCAWLLEQSALRLRYAVAAGMFFGAAFMIKPFVAPLFAGEMAFVAYWLRRHGHTIRTMVSVPLAGLVGFSVPVVAALAWLAAIGGFWPFIDIAVNYMVPIYSRSGSVSLRHLGHILISEHPYSLFLLATLVVGTCTIWSARMNARFGVLMVAVLGALAHFFLQRKGWHYHLLPFAAFGSMMCCWPLEQAMQSFNLRWRSIWISTTMLLVVPLAATLAGDAFNTSAWPEHESAAGLSKFLRSQEIADRSVQVMDTTTGIEALLRAGMKLPTRFMNDFPFFSHDERKPYIAALRKEFLTKLTERPPRFIVVFEASWGTGGYERIEKFPELDGWLRRNYVMRNEQNGYRVFEKSTCQLVASGL